MISSSYSSCELFSSSTFSDNVRIVDATSNVLNERCFFNIPFDSNFPISTFPFRLSPPHLKKSSSLKTVLTPNTSFQTSPISISVLSNNGSFLSMLSYFTSAFIIFHYFSPINFSIIA